MKAKPSDQLTLLDLQALDQRESVLRHQRDSHPAHATVRELAGRIDDLQRSQITQNSVISDLSREIERITHEIELVSARRDRQRGRIEANEVPLRDISSMEHEIAQMQTRLSRLEDDQLSVEEQRENAQKARESMLSEIEGMKASIEQTKAEFMAEVAEADDELRAVIAKRRELAASIAKDLLDEYERVRALNGALAVLEVRNGVGIGMAAEISPLERETIRTTPADEVYWAEDTGAIVVRTQQARD
ncbi:hypothetical protein HMPREF9004_1528 [Schaalia cardiffensis F0333]|uniref:CT398-like coiled coil hairpin domain-containing protein n=1 Tax=Schaalia cardiffensis F0333 TaxID=888050 RepID=N6X8Z5_9ACTO|nr:hypothetical protein [Schaalia cardiffensis]ENO17618.1 hypothetical protein HMPREF9004_1528 [Schaalia cardiffensis F0333]